MLGMLAMKEVWISNPLAQFVGGAPHASGRRGGALVWGGSDKSDKSDMSDMSDCNVARLG
ncbi:MAG: hypothetical protein RL240_2713 [Planctomycetota bacterium]